MDGVNCDEIALGIRNWRMVTLDTARWRKVLEDARSQE